MLVTACKATNDSIEEDSENYQINMQKETTQQPSPSPTPESSTAPTVTGNAHEENEGIVPFMWLITAPNGQTMYMYGSIHFADPDLYPLSPIIMDAFDRSDYLAMEIWETDYNEYATIMEGFMLYTDGRVITNDISDNLRQRIVDVFLEYQELLQEWVKPMVPSFQDLDIYVPMVWHQQLAFIAAELSGLSMGYSLDNFFAGAALERGMSILSIETIASSAEAIYFLPLPAHIWFIEQSLDVLYNAESYINLYTYWKTGDDETIQRLLINSDDIAQAELGPEISDQMINSMYTQRRLLMADRAEEFMAEGKKVFFVVGASHLLGDNNVIELLTERGYDAQRIR